MESAKTTIELEIGIITYSMEAEIFYSVTVEEGDFFHPAFSETEINRTEIISEIKAWNNETDIEYTVEDPNEVKMIEAWIDWEEELKKAF